MSALPERMIAISSRSCWPSESLLFWRSMPQVASYQAVGLWPITDSPNFSTVCRSKINFPF